MPGLSGPPGAVTAAPATPPTTAPTGPPTTAPATTPVACASRRKSRPLRRPSADPQRAAKGAKLLQRAKQAPPAEHPVPAQCLVPQLRLRRIERVTLRTPGPTARTASDPNRTSSLGMCNDRIWPEPVWLLSGDPNAKADDDVRPKLANLHAYLEPQLGSWLKQCYERS